MSETATCMLGQNGTEATAPMPVTLRPNEGNFPSDGDYVRLISNNDRTLSAKMTVEKWLPDGIVAVLPKNNPGTGAEGEEFTVEAKSGETTYEASPVWVTGPPGSGYPPTHLTAGRMTAPHK